MRINEHKFIPQIIILSFSYFLTLCKLVFLCIDHFFITFTKFLGNNQRKYYFSSLFTV